MEDETPDEAAVWVAYLRDRAGADAVPVWSVGNEHWNPLEHNGNFRRPRRYVERSIERVVESMRATLGQALPLSLDEWNILATARNFIVPRSDDRGRGVRT